MILNIRGPNGAGKTTAARWFLETGARVEVALTSCPAPTKTDPSRLKDIIGYLDPNRNVIVVGPYKTACGGMDAISNFEIARNAIMTCVSRDKHAIAEGVIASTVYGSWGDFASALRISAITFAFAYLRVPAEECLRRVYARNGGKKIDEELVRGKWKAVEATRTKALAAGHAVYDLPLGFNEAGLACWEILQGEGEKYRASSR